MTRAIILAGLLGAAALGGPARGQDADEVAKLKREVELLKRENDLLTRENALLKKEAEDLKKGGAKPAGAGGGGPAKTTLNGVEYEFIGITRDGKRATLRVAATSKRGDATLIRPLHIKLVAADGTVHQSPPGTSGGKTPAMGKLFEGVRQVVEFDLGILPTELTEFTTIMIPGKDDKGFKALKDPALLKGKFKVE